MKILRWRKRTKKSERYYLTYPNTWDAFDCAPLELYRAGEEKKEYWEISIYGQAVAILKNAPVNELQQRAEQLLKQYQHAYSQLPLTEISGITHKFIKYAFYLDIGIEGLSGLTDKFNNAQSSMDAEYRKIAGNTQPMEQAAELLKSCKKQLDKLLDNWADHNRLTMSGVVILKKELMLNEFA